MGGIIAAEACSLLAHLIVRAVNLPSGSVDAKEFLDRETAEYYETSGLSKKSGWGFDQMKWLVTSTPVNRTESCWNWKREKQDIAGTLAARGRRYNGYPVSSGYFGSYALDGLALALWSVYHTHSFDTAVARSINLFGDSDSHGSITGQLAGALYGFNTIHPQFKKWVNAWDDHEFAVRGLLLHHLGGERTQEHIPRPIATVDDCHTRPDDHPLPLDRASSDLRVPDDELLPEQPPLEKAKSAMPMGSQKSSKALT